jgi:uncharacterized membrane protein YhaH (DUF805 family)
MLAAIKHNLANLFNFTGRDARQTFWYYVLFVYIVTTVVSMLAMIPAMVEMFTNIIDVAKAGGSPELAQQTMANSMSGLFGSVGWVSMVVGGLFIILLAASLVRRLHDSDMPGLWALAPGALQVLGIAMMPAQLAAMTAAMADPAAMSDPTAMYRAQGVAGLIGWVAIGLVIWFGVRKSSPGANRFGDSPASF